MNNIAPHIRTLREGETAEERKAAAEAIGEFGPEAHEAVSALITALQDEDLDVRIEAVPALIYLLGRERPRLIFPGKVEPEAWNEIVREGLEQLQAAGLYDEFSQANREVEYLKDVAAQALGRIGKAAIPAVPTLIAALKDLDSEARAEAASALGLLGHRSGQVEDALMEATHDKDEAVREEAVHALAALEAVPTLISILEYSDLNTGFVLNALAHMGDKAKEALPGLRKLLADDELDEEFREMVAETIESIEHTERG